jgi:hypothetical protein
VREDRLIHAGKHTGYNTYVGHMLDSIKTVEQFIEFTEFLRTSCRHRSQDIPWS